VDKLIKKNEQGQEYEDISREGVVLETTHPELKKNDVVYYNPRGCVSIDSNKKRLILAVDNDDVYVLL
jgi:hypothetical protein